MSLISHKATSDRNLANAAKKTVDGHGVVLVVIFLIHLPIQLLKIKHIQCRHHVAEIIDLLIAL